MKQILPICNNEKGTALIVALLILVLLTLMGISATTTSTIEVQMAGNEKFYEMAFYSAESGWQQALNWLDGQYPGVTQNLIWDEDAVTFTPVLGNFEDAATDGISLAKDNNTEYYVKIEFLGTMVVPGYGTNFRRFTYRVNSEGRVSPTATRPCVARSEVRVTAGKVFDVGGY
jgi:hypothetical protein